MRAAQLAGVQAVESLAHLKALRHRVSQAANVPRALVAFRIDCISGQARRSSCEQQVRERALSLAFVQAGSAPKRVRPLEPPQCASKMSLK